MNDINLISALFSGMSIVMAYLIVRPQMSENKAIHKSLDNNTEALKELTSAITDMKQQQARNAADISNLFHRYDELQDDLKEVRQRIGCVHCKAGEANA